jgi:threonine/homoserine/homoserine lactone efflux protein
VDATHIPCHAAVLARRILRSRPRATVIVTRVAGVVMILIGLGILV